MTKLRRWSTRIFAKLPIAGPVCTGYLAASRQCPRSLVPALRLLAQRARPQVSPSSEWNPAAAASPWFAKAPAALRAVRASDPRREASASKSKAYQVQLGPGAAMVLQDVELSPAIRAVRDDLAVDHGLVRKRSQCPRDRSEALGEVFAVAGVFRKGRTGHTNSNSTVIERLV
jgi:hypothetical protein